MAVWEGIGVWCDKGLGSKLKHGTANPLKGDLKVKNFITGSHLCILTSINGRKHYINCYLRLFQVRWTLALYSDNETLVTPAVDYRSTTPYPSIKCRITVHTYRQSDILGTLGIVLYKLSRSLIVKKGHFTLLCFNFMK